MSRYVGSFDPPQTRQSASEHLNRLRTRFPGVFSGATTLKSGSLAINGSFEQGSYTDRAGCRSEVYFNGLLFNGNELKRTYSLTNIPVTETARLISAIFEKAGEKALSVFNGQFLLLIHKPEKDTLSIFTDQSGIRQLFYGQFGGSLVFASELKYLLQHPSCSGEIDWDFSLRHPHASTIVHPYREYGTWFKGIRLLPQGSELLVNSAGAQPEVRPYLPITDDAFWCAHKKKYRSVHEVREDYFALLEDAVRVRIGNGPTAYSFLSGGLDSATLAAIAAGMKPTATFSAVTQITLLEGTTALCGSLARRSGYSNHQYIVPTHHAMSDPVVWSRLVWSMESPMNHVDALSKSMLHYAIRKHHPEAQQVMTGTGSDDLNGGYVHWMVGEQNAGRKDRWEVFEQGIRDAVMRRIISFEDGDLWQRRQLINPIRLGAPEADVMQCYALSSLYSNAYHLVWDEVRAAARHGHEVLFPFLDHRFYAFIAGIPPALYPELFYDKSILRIPARRLLPKNVTEKRKVPINPPAKYDQHTSSYHRLVKARRFALLEEAFGAPDAPHEVIDKKALVKMVSGTPGLAEWNHLLHVINLGLLAQLRQKGEADMNLENAVGEIIPVPPGRGHAFRHDLEKRLDIEEAFEPEDVLEFAGNVRFLTDKASGFWYLSKDEQLSYELGHDHAAWIVFLRAVDGKKSIGRILRKSGKSQSDVEEFLRTLIREQVLNIKKRKS